MTVPHLVETIFRTQGSQGKFRQLQNNLVFLVADDATRDEMKNKMVYRLALEAMRSPDRLAQLPEHQQDKVNELYKKSEQFDVLESLRRLAFSEKVARPKQLELWLVQIA